MNGRRLLCGVGLAGVLAALAHATSIKDVSLVELFKEADLVALVHITGGDDGFDRAVYRATVTRSFKGVSPDDAIYFGPHSPYSIGADYVVFLKRTEHLEGHMFKRSGNPWPTAAEAPYFEIFYAGYSVLPVEYTCDFPGCDYGVLVPSSQVHLPGGVPIIAATHERSSNYDTWVKKATMLELLGKIKAGAGQ